MTVVTLDAGNWSTLRDFYRALLGVLGAPEWHGYNMNALLDSMIWGGALTLKPPYTIIFLNVDKAPKTVRDRVELLREVIASGREDLRAMKGYELDVNIEII